MTRNASDPEIDSRYELELPDEPQGASPGTLHFESDERPLMFLMDYSEGHLIERELTEIEECRPHIKEPGVTWIDVRGIGHRQTFEKLGEIFQIHPLALEDMVHVPQRPKADTYVSQQLLVTRMVSIHEDHLNAEQISILFGEGFVVTVQEEPRVDCLDPLRERLRSGRGLLRKSASDYLAYAIFDTIIDGFYPVLEHFGDKLDDLEMRTLANEVESSREIVAIKREILTLRRALWPQRDLINGLLRDGSPHISDNTRLYLRDTYDHAVQLMDMVETFREIASSLMDLLMTGASNRLNEVMKVLTIVSTIFLPMTFVAGLYGMNFHPDSSPLNMPELTWYWGYPFSLVLMVGSAGTLLLYYRYKGYVGTNTDTYARMRKLLRPKKKKKRKAKLFSR